MTDNKDTRTAHEVIVDDLRAENERLRAEVTEAQMERSDAEIESDRLRADLQALGVEYNRVKAEVESYRRLADPEAYAAAYADHPTESGMCGYNGCRLSLAEHHRLAFGLIQEIKALRREAGDE